MRRGPKLAVAAGSLAVAALAAMAQGTTRDATGGASEGAEEAADLAVLGRPVTLGMIELGAAVYAESCAACHGVELEGQPDWRRRMENGRMPAPPHDGTGHTWHHADRDLFRITKLGVGGVVPGYESDMPAFEGLLSDDEITAVLAYIKTSWSDRERTFQADVSARTEDAR
ncbi:cytochrome c [Jannaschia sp. W003]|uniref:c-type cytochrome n=1 Tax=Jannaschia sp. W003 TaxID=2867012 RepID=UPI0021A7E5FA|nr:cytochrome c [Jannaschia sp. W003]UWQ20102.1 cytochrome c [Jannaschia sp. W003]